MIKLIIILSILFIKILPAYEWEGFDIYSDNFGKWERSILPFEKDSAGCFDILSYSDTLFVASSKKVLLFSIDKGYSWKIFKNSMIENPASIRHIFRNNYIFAAILSGNLSYMVSVDEGITWQTSDIGILSIDNPPINDGMLYGDKFILATDIGLKFTSIYNDSLRDFHGGDLDSGEHTSRIMCDENNNLYVSTLNGLLKSIDNGQNWKIIVSKDKKVEYGITYYLKVQNDTVYALNIEQNIIICKIGENNWSEISSVINDYPSPHKIFNIEKSIVVVVAGGIIVSHDNTLTWDEYLFQINSQSGYPYPFYQVIREGNYLIGVNQLGIFRIKLTDIGITPTSVETQRNYLYTLPPYPLPSQNEVKVQFYWDINLPMTADNITVYDITGRKLITKDKIRLEKQADHYGNLIWDCSGEEPGICLINIKHGTEERTVKVVVE